MIDYFNIHNEFPYIYMITNRVALADKFKNDFIGFTHYQDNVSNITDKKEVIVQLDSIAKCIDINKVKNRDHNILILDEIESILSHFNSDTLSGKLKNVAETFIGLIENSHKILIADAFITQRTIDVVNRISGDRKISFEKNEQHNIKRDLFIQRHNKQVFCPKQKKNMIDDCEDECISKIISLIKEGKRVVFPCASK